MVLLVGALVLMTLAAVNFYFGRNAEQERRIWAEDQLQKITAAKEQLEQERDELTHAKETLEGQLGEATTRAKQLADEIAQEKRGREAMTAELALVRKESTQVKSQLETERREKLTLTEELAKAKQSYQALANELTTLRQAKEALEKRVKEMLSAQATEAEKIVVTPRKEGKERKTGVPVETITPAPIMPPPAPKANFTPAARVAPAVVSAKAAGLLEGKVLVVNKEFNFVVVNLGSRDGLKAGARLALLRQDKAIGTAQVERVYENMSAANLITEEQKGKVQEGDTVRLSS
jgi:hypothetical protein